MWRQALGRTPLRAWAGSKAAAGVPAGERVTIYRVNLKPKKGPIRRAVAYTLTGVICYQIWDKIVTLPLRNLDPRSLPDIDKDEKLEPIFLPLPFTVQEVQPPPYAGTDEEWQSFMKFNKDVELRERVTQDLRSKVKKAADNNPTLKKWRNSNQGFQAGPAWLNISYPLKPPPEFVRWGLESNEEGLFLKQKKLDARTKALLDRVLLPYPVASASYAFVSAMVKQNVSTVANLFGYSVTGNQINTGAKMDPDIQKTLKKFEATQTATRSTSSSPPPTPEASTTSAPATASAAEPSPSPGTPGKTVNTDNPTSSPNKDSDKSMAKNAISYYTTLGDASGPWAAFQEKYKRTWKPLKYLPPRGSFAVYGLVSLDSPKGRLLIDVFAWYHPKTGQFHDDSLLMQLRSINPRVQRPLR